MKTITITFTETAIEVSEDGFNSPYEVTGLLQAVLAHRINGHISKEPQKEPAAE